MPAPAMTASTVEFASAARNLTREARRRGLVGPSYRCPPRLVGVDRTIRRHDDPLLRLMANLVQFIPSRRS